MYRDTPYSTALAGDEASPLALGASADPTAYIPGDPAAVHALATRLRAAGAVFANMIPPLGRAHALDWRGPAADAYHTRLDALRGASHQLEMAGPDTARALDTYGHSLSTAQAMAGQAISDWTTATTPDTPNPDPKNESGEAADQARRDAARATLTRARGMAQDAGRDLITALSTATTQLPTPRHAPDPLGPATPVTLRDTHRAAPGPRSTPTHHGNPVAALPTRRPRDLRELPATRPRHPHATH